LSEFSERHSGPQCGTGVGCEFVVAEAQVWTNACPAMTTVAARSVRNPRIGRSRCLSWP
jgi:hypothetical protein